MCEFRRVASELGLPGPVTLQNSYSLVSRSVDNDLAEVLDVRFELGRPLLPAKNHIRNRDRFRPRDPHHRDGTLADGGGDRGDCFA